MLERKLRGGEEMMQNPGRDEIVKWNGLLRGIVFSGMHL
jgi:hypothetical protein